MSFDVIATAFASATAGGCELLTSPSDFDLELRDLASRQASDLLDDVVDGAELYSWAGESRAYCSGIEAWLQHEVLLTLTTERSGPAPKSPVVIRVADVQKALDPWTVVTRHATFLVIPRPLLDRSVAFQRAVLTMTLHAPEPYAADDRWLRTNIMGGAHMEAAARSERLGFAYAAVLEFLEGGTVYSNSPFLGECSDWIPHRAGLCDEGLGAGATDVEILVRAPLRFAVFQEWGHARTKQFAETPRGDFGRERSADNSAMRCLRALADEVKVGGVGWGAFFGRAGVASGMPICLLLKRLDRLQTGLGAAVEWLCSSRRDADPPAMARLSQAEVMLRCASVVTTQLMWDPDEEMADALLRCVEEMQMFCGLAEGMLLARLGGTIHLARLCRVEWEAVLRFYEQQHEALERLTAEDLAELGNGLTQAASDRA